MNIKFIMVINDLSQNMITATVECKIQFYLFFCIALQNYFGIQNFLFKIEKNGATK
jgi:hypothetical protein